MWRKYLEVNNFCHYIRCSIEAFLLSHLQKTQECRAIDGLSHSLTSTCGHMGPPPKGWLIDAYEEGLLDKMEFEPRIRGARERLAKLEAEVRTEAEREAQEGELRLVIGQLQEFAQRVQEGLHDPDWTTRRAIIQALVKRVEVDAEEVRVVYKISPLPFAEGPDGGRLQDCGRRDLTFVVEHRHASLCVGVEDRGP